MKKHWPACVDRGGKMVVKRVRGWKWGPMRAGAEKRLSECREGGEGGTLE